MSDEGATSISSSTAMTPTGGGAIQQNVGFIGLGAMGLPMALNVKKRLADGYDLFVYDVNAASVQAAVQQAGAIAATCPAELGSKTNVVITMLPNDTILRKVVCDEQTGLLSSSRGNFQNGIHIGCSTVHPDTSREMATLHKYHDSTYIGSPIFARADGVAHRAASMVVGGDAAAIETVRPILESMASMGIYTFGDNDAGAGNVVKLCGNFMIGAAIESCAEACSLAEKSGLDRVGVMDMLTSTIFDCLIYKGYGMRTAHRQHIPGQPLVGPEFQLDLGLKDISLTNSVAQQVHAPMPFCSVLQDRFLTSQAKEGRGGMDWSALGLLASEEAGIDVSAWLPGGENNVDAGDSVAPM
jgi:3-hydroxyisobutyrate dehydrogenase-like beta-hydroxyacid dehydrogenase